MYGQIADSYLSRTSDTQKDAMLQPLICVLWLTMWSNAMYWLLEGVIQCTGYLKEESRDCMDGMRAGVGM